MNVTVYILESTVNGKRYVGITHDLQRRLAEHTSKKTKAGQILGRFHLLHKETYPDYKTARRQEKFFKSGKGRAYLNQKYPRTGPAQGG